MNFTDELRQVLVDRQQSIESNRSSHAVENEFVTYVVEMIKDNCKQEALRGKTHLQGFLYKDTDNDYGIYRGPNNVHALCYGDFILSSGIHRIRGFDGHIATHDLEDDVFIVNELRKRLSMLGFANLIVELTYAPKVVETEEYKRTFWGTKKVKNTIVHEKYWKNLFISVDW